MQSPERETVWWSRTGPDVEHWQTILFNAGFPRKIDGKFGSHTFLYTTLFQLKMGIEANGIVDARTWMAAERHGYG